MKVSAANHVRPMVEVINAPDVAMNDATNGLQELETAPVSWFTGREKNAILQIPLSDLKHLKEIEGAEVVIDDNEEVFADAMESIRAESQKDSLDSSVIENVAMPTVFTASAKPDFEYITSDDMVDVKKK